MYVCWVWSKVCRFSLDSVMAGPNLSKIQNTLSNGSRDPYVLYWNVKRKCGFGEVNSLGLKMSVSWETINWVARFCLSMSKRFTSKYGFAQNGWINCCLPRENNKYSQNIFVKMTSNFIRIYKKFEAFLYQYCKKHVFQMLWIIYVLSPGTRNIIWVCWEEVNIFRCRTELCVVSSHKDHRLC